MYPNMAQALIAVGVGIVLSPFFGLGSWLKWQPMKVGSLIPTGSATARYGQGMGWVLQIPCWLALLSFVEYLHWWVVLASGVMWFVSDWLATVLERQVYGTRHNLKLIVLALEEYGGREGEEVRLQLLENFAPAWWRRLMTPSWQYELRREIQHKFEREKEHVMAVSAPSLDEFKAQMEALFGQSLNRPASDAAEDFWEHWSSFSTLIRQRSLTVNVDALRLGMNLTQYQRYRIWKGLGIIAILFGIISVWFHWQLGVSFIVVGTGLHMWGGRVKFDDCKNFSEDLMEEATLNPSGGGYGRLCVHYIAGTIQLVSPTGSALRPQFPSNVVTGERTFISTSDITNRR
jgi:hypothetical protein